MKKGERYTIEWIPTDLVEQAARERGYENDDAYSRSFWDYVNQDEFTQKKSFASRVKAFKAAKNRVKIDVCGEVRIAHEYYDPNLDFWEERFAWRVTHDCKSLKEAA